MQYMHQELSTLVPRPADLTAKQRRRIRDLLAFVHATGQRCRGLVTKHAAGTTLLFGTGYDDSGRFVVHSELLSAYDVDNHPFVAFHAALEACGFLRERSRSRPQQYVSYRRYHSSFNTDPQPRDYVSVRQVSEAVFLHGKIPSDVEELCVEYVKEIDARLYDGYQRRAVQ